MAQKLEFVVIANSSQYKAEMAKVKAIAQGIGNGGGGGHEGHGGIVGLSSGGGQAGMIREFLVVLREAGRGNWARIPGSISLLAQYMGVFSKILKVTHSDLAQHALDLEKEAQAMANAALAEAVRNGTSRLQQEAALAMTAAEKARADGTADATALTIIAKQKEAAAYAEAAAIEGKATTTALGPIGWLIAAVVALGVAIYFTFNHFKHLATQQDNLAEALGGVNHHFEDQTKRMNDMADAARKLAVQIANVHKHEKTLAEISDEAIESLRRNSKAKEELAKANHQVQLHEIDLAEKMHRISAQEATRQRAAVEIQTIHEEHAIKTKLLEDERKQRESDYNEAVKKDKNATNEYRAKAKKSTEAGAHGDASIKTLADLKRQEELLSKQADLIQKAENDRPGGESQRWISHGGPGGLGGGEWVSALPKPVTIDGKEMPAESLESVQSKLAATRANMNKAQAKMSASDIATAKAEARMESTTASKVRLKTELDKAEQAKKDDAKNSKDLEGAQIKSARLRESARLYEEGQKGVTQGFSLNSQQRVGAYAATPPDFKRLVDAAIRTAQNTDNLRGGVFNPVGSIPAKFGPGGHH
jgi:hypothetical protein